MPKINQEEHGLLKELDDKWKWIARSNLYGGKLEAHTSKPTRMLDSHWSNGDMTLEFLGGEHQFQFIQWEDSEPYSIAELIEEYERESEETEVKKDKQWLEKELRNLEKLVKEALEASLIAKNEHYTEKNSNELQLLRRVFSLVNQLDEPEVLSQEWIDERAIHIRGLGNIIEEETIKNLLVPKQEELKVSKTWHDVIAQNKEEGHSLRWTLNYIDNLNVNDVDDFAKAWLAYPNIEVEKEHKYYAKIKGWELFVDFVGTQYWGVVSNYGRLGFVSIDGAKERTKDEWKRLGINDTNADFVKVEEMEE